MTDGSSLAHSLRDIANIAEAHVVSLPQHSLSLLLCLSLGLSKDSEVTVCQESREAELAKLSNAVSYLETEFVPAFSGIAGDLSEELARLHITLLDHVRRFLHKIQAATDGVDAKGLLSLAETAREILAPAVTSFLSAMFAQVVAHEKLSVARTMDAENGALTEIDLISRKINFIAVNASVEAARAGESGRGFSVIASEIRELSQQSRAAVVRMREDLA